MGVHVWGITSIVGAFILALIVASIVFPVVIFAVPVALVGIGIAGFIDFNRRRKQAQMIHQHREQARSEKIDFTERDQQTLVSE
jgi:predicted membrane protein